ncbi:MAG TPA: hypothetical protein VKM55_05735 [Candidatus Lokiarchaeia archaeon]|nr:hypothetical protein [Candidatus Lokiarchaeia archaeon]
MSREISFLWARCRTRSLLDTGKTPSGFSFTLHLRNDPRLQTRSLGDQGLPPGCGTVIDNSGLLLKRV